MKAAPVDSRPVGPERASSREDSQRPGVSTSLRKRLLLASKKTLENVV